MIKHVASKDAKEIDTKGVSHHAACRKSLPPAGRMCVHLPVAPSATRVMRAHAWSCLYYEYYEVYSTGTKKKSVFTMSSDILTCITSSMLTYRTTTCHMQTS